MTLNLGAVVYFDHDLAADPAPMEALLGLLRDTPELRMWTARAKSSTKPVPLSIEKLMASLRAGGIVAVGVETPDRAVTLNASTGPSSSTLPRAWKYDLVLALSNAQVAALGIAAVETALCDFAAAVAATAGVVLWSPSLSYARALALLASGDDLTKEQASRVSDAYYWRSKWGDVIRGPEWGTFLSTAHVQKLAGRELPAAKTIVLSSGGPFVQATADPFDVDAPPTALEALREALAPVLPS
jgi:hypothetical protein